MFVTRLLKPIMRDLNQNVIYYKIMLTNVPVSHWLRKQKKKF